MYVNFTVHVNSGILQPYNHPYEGEVLGYTSASVERNGKLLIEACAVVQITPDGGVTVAPILYVVPVSNLIPSDTPNLKRF